MNFAYSTEVRAAIERQLPLVALESTLITHGLPRPVNLRTARHLENVIREAGASPATIAIMHGRIHIGLEDAHLEELANADDVRKCSSRDLPVAVSRGEHGATTVAATMHLAHLAGIRVFATGGIGGVHRGHPYDLSADLEELGRTPITVVCAGAKSILDLPLTLEALETRGVPVIGYRCDEFPAFYSRSSGLPVDARCDDPIEVVRIIQARNQLRLKAALLVCAPVPEDAELPADEIDAVIQRALLDADKAGIRGREVTPFLLAQVSRLTDERSQAANLALLENNAQLAAAIAREI